jgi:hypothetical protein
LGCGVGRYAILGKLQHCLKREEFSILSQEAEKFFKTSTKQLDDEYLL